MEAQLPGAASREAGSLDQGAAPDARAPIIRLRGIEKIYRPIGVSLVVTLIATLIVIRLPVRRAVQMPPGTALRYE